MIHAQDVTIRQQDAALHAFETALEWSTRAAEHERITADQSYEELAYELDVCEALDALDSEIEAAPP